MDLSLFLLILLGEQTKHCICVKPVIIDNAKVIIREYYKSKKKKKKKKKQIDSAVFGGFVSVSDLASYWVTERDTSELRCTLNGFGKNWNCNETIIIIIIICRFL